MRSPITVGFARHRMLVLKVDTIAAVVDGGAMTNLMNARRQDDLFPARSDVSSISQSSAVQHEIRYNHPRSHHLTGVELGEGIHIAHYKGTGEASFPSFRATGDKS